MASTTISDQATTKLFDGIEKLKADGTNWDVWKTQITLILKHCRLLPYAEGLKLKPLPVPATSSGQAPAGPNPANAADIEEWEQANLETQIQIFMTLDYKTTLLMNGKEVVADIWTALKSHFEGKGLTAVAMLVYKLWQYHIQTENDMSVQIQDMKNIALKLSSLGYPLSDEYQAMAVLQALPSDWNTIWSIILNKSGSFMRQGTIDALLEHETTLWQQHKNMLMVHHDHKSQSPAPPNVVPRAPNRLICSNCKIPGHSINTCHFEGGGAESQNPKKKRSRPNLHSRGQKEATVHIVQENCSPSPPSNVYMLHANEDALLSNKAGSSTDSPFFMIDSGATAHMCHDQSYYSTYQNFNSPWKVHIANNGYLETVSVRDINIQTHHNGHSRAGLIKGVLHLPKL